MLVRNQMRVDLGRHMLTFGTGRGYCDLRSEYGVRLETSGARRTGTDLRLCLSDSEARIPAVLARTRFDEDLIPGPYNGGLNGGWVMLVAAGRIGFSTRSQLDTYYIAPSWLSF